MDAQNKPRPIDEEVFTKQRKPWDRPVGKPYMTKQQRFDQLWSDHDIYQEKKLEQQDRI